MRLTITLLLFFQLPCFYVVGQQYVPFPTANAVWRENGTNHGSGIPGNYSNSFYEISIVGDTIINNLTYHELDMNGYAFFWINYVGPYPFGLPWEVCNGAIREDSLKRIYYYDYQNNIENLLYDFNLSLGDTLPQTMMCDPNRYVVTAIDSIDVNGIYHKRYQIADTYNANFPIGYYIEGIGSTMGLTGGELHKTENPFEIYSWSICFGLNGSTTLIETIFGTSQQYDCDLLNTTATFSSTKEFYLFPNPANLQFEIEFPESGIKRIEIFNSLGQLIYSQQVSGQSVKINCEALPRGIYIINATGRDKIVSGKFIKE